MQMLYEYNSIISSKIDLDNIEKIEKLRENLHINNGILRNIIDNDAIDGVLIEGNQLDRYEITMFLQDGITVRGKLFKDFVQAKNYHRTLERLTSDIFRGKMELSEGLIKSIHRVVTAGEIEPEYSGQYRDDAVFLRTTDRVPPYFSEVPDNIAYLIEQYHRPLEYETQFERICEFKRNFELIHPFFDGNGRTGRVLMNMLFLQNGYSYVPIPFKDRKEYFDSLENNNFVSFMAPHMIQSMEKVQTIEKDFLQER